MKMGSRFAVRTIAVGWLLAGSWATGQAQELDTLEKIRNHYEVLGFTVIDTDSKKPSPPRIAPSFS